MIKETKSRSILKSITWRCCATLTTFILVWVFTKELDVAIIIGGLEAFLKIIIYFLHERLWIFIKYGKKEISPYVLWFTGLSGSGKTELAESVSRQLDKMGFKVEHLDGKNIRSLFPDIDYSKQHVNDHIKRVGLLASRLENKGIFVCASFLSPYRESRQFVRQMCRHFMEIHVSTPLEVCEKNDGRGLYSAARQGKIKNLPGVDVQYEVPENPDLTIDLSKQSIDQATSAIVQSLKKNL